MVRAMREPTLRTIGLGSVIDIFRRGQLPADVADLVSQVFGEPGHRGCLVISGANGTVGSGKAMQLGSRLQPFDVPIVALDLPGGPDGLGERYSGLVRAVGPEAADKVMGNITRLSYDGKSVPIEMGRFRPKLLFEAIPELLEVKKAHYSMFRGAFPELEIRSATSGFPSSELGVGIAHPCFPHERNKVWEVVEPKPSAFTKLLWALGLIPVPVSDHWSFVLDVLFAGLTLATLRYHDASNMPFWKIDKHTRKLLGPNPFRAHDAIGARTSNFLTWSCLHHLSEQYGAVFKPTALLEERRKTGEPWYPPSHLKPVVDWTLTEGAHEDLKHWILGPLFQFISLILAEQRSHTAHVNAISEKCAQFTLGILAVARNLGPEKVVATVESYHQLHPEAAHKSWFPEVFDRLDDQSWQQLYVNAEHDGRVGVVTLSRESYNHEVDRELNQALDWLTNQNIERVIVTGDFHLSTQMVGADTSEFFPALERASEGFEISSRWSRTARRLNDEFTMSVGFVCGKRCLGGMLELLMHCHYLIAQEDAALGMPEVTQPVVPGMEGCHWPFRKADQKHWPQILQLLLSGEPVRASDAVGWLVDYAGPMNDALKVAWNIATDGNHNIPMRTLQTGELNGSLKELRGLPTHDGAKAISSAILQCVELSCHATLPEALNIQAKRSSAFMLSSECRLGKIGEQYTRIMGV